MDFQILLQQIFNGLLQGSVYTLVALGLTMTMGLLHILNVAHGEFLMLGAYITYSLVKFVGLGFFESMVVAIVAVGVLGIIIERCTFRYCRDEHMNGLLVSFGLIAIFQNLALAWWRADPVSIPPPYPDVLRIFGLSLPWQRLLIFAIAIGLIVALGVFLRYTKTGRGIRATAQNREAAALMGVNVDRITGISFFIGSGLAGAAGALVGTVFAITPAMGFGPVIKAFVVMVMGGMGSVPGAVLGGYLLGTGESLASGYASTALKEGFGFAVLILVLLFKPSGLMRSPVER